MPIDVRRVGSTELIRAGAFGEVLRVPDLRLSGHPELAYKRFLEPMPSADSANLRELIAFRDALTSSERALLDELFVWPLDLVVDGPAPVGFVMELLSEPWFRQVVGTNETRPRDVQPLISNTAAAARAGVAVPPPGGDPTRLVFCAKLAQAFALLHRAGIVYGDLHSENVIFQLDPLPRLRFVDCDAAKARPGNDVKVAHHSHWIPPEGFSAPQTVATDCYKLGLFVLRCLADGPGSASARKPSRVGGALGPDGPAMLTRALGPDPAQRPSAKDWYVFLRRLINELTQPPRVERIAIGEQIVLAGSRITVEWEVAGATSLSVVTADGTRVQFENPARSGLTEVAVAKAGQIEIIAENDYGTSHGLSPIVSVFEPPSIRFVNIPEPAIPVSDLGTDRRLVGAIVSALERTPGPPVFALPELPDLVRQGPSASLPALSMEALDVSLLPLLDSLDRAMSALSHQAQALAPVVRSPAPSSDPGNGTS